MGNHGDAGQQCKSIREAYLQFLEFERRQGNTEVQRKTGTSLKQAANLNEFHDVDCPLYCKRSEFSHLARIFIEGDHMFKMGKKSTTMKTSRKQ